MEIDKFRTRLPVRKTFGKKTPGLNQGTSRTRKPSGLKVRLRPFAKNTIRGLPTCTERINHACAGRLEFEENSFHDLRAASVVKLQHLERKRPRLLILMFILKKIIGLLLSPVTFCLLLLLAGLLLLWFAKKRQRAGKILVTVGVVLLVILSFDIVPSALLNSLENRYPKIDVALDDAARHEEMKRTVKWIVVLGAGHVSDARLPASSQLNAGALARTVEGVRLQREFPSTKLLLSGAQVFDPVSVAAIMKRVALELGVNDADIVLDEASKDTEEEAHAIQAIVRDDEFIMVTSAWHMPRAMALFNKLGMRPIPAPTDFQVKRAPAGTTHSPGDFFPGTGGLIKAEKACYEYLGIAWSKLRGRA